MSTNEKEVLRGIMHDLKSGFTFGKGYTWDYYNSRPMRFPYFSSVLYVTPSGFLREYIRNDESKITA